MESTLGDGAPSLLLFDHSMKDALLNNSDGNPSSNATSLFVETSNTLSEDSTAAIPSDGGTTLTTYLFFVFPIIGFFVLVLGGCLLRKRQLRQDAEAIRRYRERLSAAALQRKLKEERRMRLVERALVTTRVTFFAKARGRTSSVETDATVDWNNDLDSTFSSSASQRMREWEGHDEESGMPPSEAANGQQFTTARCRLSTSECTIPENFEGTSFDWQRETCAICLEAYRENDEVSYSRHRNCAHAFHTSCILSWLKDELRNDCPYCRGPYLHLCVVEDEGECLGGGGGDAASTTRPAELAEVMDPTSEVARRASDDDGAGDSNV